jgi:hypothetical protein
VLQTLYEEASKFADPFAVATECMIQITSAEHLERVLTTAGGAKAGYTGYEDAQGNWRNPHKLVMVEVYANWCRACLGVTPRLLKMCAQHPEVLCCKVNKGDLEVRLQFEHMLLIWTATALTRLTAKLLARICECLMRDCVSAMLYYVSNDSTYSHMTICNMIYCRMLPISLALEDYPHLCCTKMARE